jgi:hypothetical protein
MRPSDMQQTVILQLRITNTQQSLRFASELHSKE